VQRIRQRSTADRLLSEICALKKTSQPEEKRSMADVSIWQHMPMRTFIFTHENKPNRKSDLTSRMAIVSNRSCRCGLLGPRKRMAIR